VVWGSLKSLRVTENSTTRQNAYEFLLAFHSNYVPILHRFYDIARYWSKSAAFNLSHHLYLAPALGLSRLNFAQIFCVSKPVCLGYHMALFVWS